jgi:prefoldin subunit 4
MRFVARCQFRLLPCGAGCRLSHKTYVCAETFCATLIRSALATMSTASTVTHTEVRRTDQEQINNFARLNARLHEVRDLLQHYQGQILKLEDASTELMMMENNEDEDDSPSKPDASILLMRGGDASNASIASSNDASCFWEVNEDEAVQYCEQQIDNIQALITSLTEEQKDIIQQQDGLKKILYGRFGAAINLEEK